MDSRALLEAAERRWDHHGSYTWHIPPVLAKKLTTELTGEPCTDAVISSSSLQRLEEECHSLDHSIEPTSYAEKDITPSLLLSGGMSNHTYS